VAIVATGRLLTARALGPMDRVVARALTIGASTLGERLPAPEVDDELGRLVVTLNEMLGRIEKSVESQRRFTADAAHELRSPLSRLRAELEITLRRPRGLEEYEAALRSCLEEVERLGALTERRCSRSPGWTRARRGRTGASSPPSLPSSRTPFATSPVLPSGGRSVSCATPPSASR
jgi:signal transduction histidine kinase